MKNHTGSKTHTQSEQHNRLSGRIALVLAAVMLLAVVAPALAGQGNIGNPPIVPPESPFHGKTYSEWSAAWFQWVYSMPFTHHPLFDNTKTDCSAGQTDHVWFLGGSAGGGSPVNRTCTIPAGTALFLAITNTSWDNTSCDPTGTFVQPLNFTVDQLRTFASQSVDFLLAGGRGFCNIDGVDIQGLSGLDPPYRVESPVFGYSVPAHDNLLVLFNGPCYQDASEADRTVDVVVADGLYLMIKPLPVGEHTIVFGRDFGGGVRNTYHITVTGP
jgi:hypothetical protein